MQIIIDEKYCKGCELCMNYCPKDVFEISEKRSAKGYLMPEAVNIENCVNCKMCEKICPDLCIEING
jgi:2-oxoglutarate ferredoxin oxidoreductase subunit delta